MSTTTGDTGLFVQNSNMSLSWNVSTWALLSCWHFNLGTSYLNVTLRSLHPLFVVTCNAIVKTLNTDRWSRLHCYIYKLHTQLHVFTSQSRHHWVKTVYVFEFNWTTADTVTFYVVNNIIDTNINIKLHKTSTQIAI